MITEDNPFAYRKPTDDQVARMKHLSDDFISPLYEQILLCVEPSAERTLTIRKLQEVRMWLNCAIVFEQ